MIRIQAQELINNIGLIGYIQKLVTTEKSAYEQVFFDLDIVRFFAEELENNKAKKSIPNLQDGSEFQPHSVFTIPVGQY